MQCTLMHKNTPVADIVVAPETGYIDKIGTLFNPEHLPVGTTEASVRGNGKLNRAYLNEWWAGRSIPASRENLKTALCGLNLRTALALALRSFGLSLSDQYWVCPKGLAADWDALNFFDNDFSNDIGEMLLGNEAVNPGEINMFSPDNTSDGWLRKKWVIRGGKRVLMKGGSGFLAQEPFNEVIACAVMRRLNIRHVAYALIFDNGKPYSLCENFVTKETDLVPAWRVIQTRVRVNSESAFTHLLRCCETLGMPDVRSGMEKMLTLDYIIANEDRHYHNFGFLRNAETLEWLGLAPVYDSGTSLWYNTPHVGIEVESKPFKKKHAEQLKLIRDLSWLDTGMLNGLEDEAAGILAQSNTVTPERGERIASAVMARAKRIGGAG